MEQGWTRPRIPLDDLVLIRRVFDWVESFRADEARLLVMDKPEQTILGEYRSKLETHHYGRKVVQHKFDTGALAIAQLSYTANGAELVAVLPPEVEALLHDLGDRKMVAAAYEAKAPIINATDSDWTEPAVQEALGHLGVTVVQLLTDEERAGCKTRELS